MQARQLTPPVREAAPAPDPARVQSSARRWPSLGPPGQPRPRLPSASGSVPPPTAYSGSGAARRVGPAHALRGPHAEGLWAGARGGAAGGALADAPAAGAGAGAAASAFEAALAAGVDAAVRSRLCRGREKAAWGYLEGLLLSLYGNIEHAACCDFCMFPLHGKPADKQPHRYSHLCRDTLHFCEISYLICHKRPLLVSPQAAMAPMRRSPRLRPGASEAGSPPDTSADAAAAAPELPAPQAPAGSGAGHSAGERGSRCPDLALCQRTLVSSHRQRKVTGANDLPSELKLAVCEGSKQTWDRTQMIEG